MKNEQRWTPSKFVLVDGCLRANPDPRQVAVASRLNVELLAGALQQAITRFARGRLLDLGCGSVPLYELYRGRVDDIVCVDWQNSVHDLSYLDVSADLNEPLPLDGAQFDTVLLSDVLEHLARPEQLLSEARRVLRPGGVLIGSVPFMYRLHEEPHDFYRYTAHALRRFAERHGFAVESIEAYGHGTDVLFETLGKLLQSMRGRWARWLTAASQRAALRVRRTGFARRLNAQHTAMPLGYAFAFRAV